MIVRDNQARRASVTRQKMISVTVTTTANQHRIVVEVSQSRYISASAHCSGIVASSRNDCIATLLETKLNKQAIGMGVQDVRKCNGSKE